MSLVPAAFSPDALQAVRALGGQKIPTGRGTGTVSERRTLARLESKKAAEYRKLKSAWRFNPATGNYESNKRVTVYDTMGHRTGSKPEQVLTPEQYTELKQSIENEYANARTQLGFPTQPYEYTPATHDFSKSAWLRANPGGNIDAAVRAARAQGYEVIP